MYENIHYPFLFLTALLFWILHKRWMRTALLVVTSYAYIWRFDRKAVFVVLGLTLFTYLIALLMEKLSKPAILHKIGVIGLLLILVAFKYLGFMGGIINSLTSFVSTLPVFKIEKLFLPLGISYIVFKHISYLTDIYWGIVKKGSLINFACYSSLYTIFIAGPIERFERLNPQLEAQTDRFQFTHLKLALQRIIFGLFKKMVIADWIGYLIIPVWQNPIHYSIIIRVLAIFGYSMQIYFDFAGYSDIAIGSSRLFGLKIMENFNNPYLAPNISQFWRRWHISLSDWIRDYLFFPLSQNKTSKFWLLFIVPITAMSLCGLWHGAAWQYIFWGMWHGISISIYQIWQYNKRKRKITFNISNSLSQVLTFGTVTLGWIIFNNGTSLFTSIFNPLGFLYIFVTLAVYYSILKINISKYIDIRSFRFMLLTTLALIVFYCGMNTGFIYDKF